MLNQDNDFRHVAVQVDASVDVLSNERKAAAVRSALRAHGNAGIEHNLAAAAAIAALKAERLPPGEFGRFCTETLQISSTYRARLLRLHGVSAHVPDALAWAATQKHRLAECQSVQNLIKVVNDWHNKDRSPSSSRTRRRRRAPPQQGHHRRAGARHPGDCGSRQGTRQDHFRARVRDRHSGRRDRRPAATFGSARTKSRPFAIPYPTKRASKRWRP